jgi:DNA-binding MarR family transcriptional regulator
VERAPLEGSVPSLIADVYELAGALRRAGDQVAGELGQSQARWQLLSVVSEGTWTVPEAARRLGVSRQAVQRVADLLATDGLVRYEDNPAHRRSPHVRVTPEGLETLRAITARSDEQNEALVAHLHPSEIAEARRVLREVLQHLQPNASRRTI